MRATKEEMIEKQLKRRGILDERVLRAMWEIDRELFVPDDLKQDAYEDGPLPIGKGQTISQPYIVGYMAQEAEIDPGSKVLEIGTGCGYSAAVFSRIASHVYSIEIIEWLAKLASENLAKTRIQNVSTRFGDGYMGWPENAPFDAILLAAAPPYIPEPLKQQLKIGGRLLAPVGTNRQRLVRIQRKGPDYFEERTLLMVSFVPMTGEAQR